MRSYSCLRRGPLRAVWFSWLAAEEEEALMTCRRRLVAWRRSAVRKPSLKRLCALLHVFWAVIIVFSSIFSRPGLFFGADRLQLQLQLQQCKVKLFVVEAVVLGTYLTSWGNYWGSARQRSDRLDRQNSSHLSSSGDSVRQYVKYDGSCELCAYDVIPRQIPRFFCHITALWLVQIPCLYIRERVSVNSQQCSSNLSEHLFMWPVSESWKCKNMLVHSL